MLPIYDIPVAWINHVLRGNPWALERLQRYASRTARLECPPVTMALQVMPGGELALAPRDAVPDLVVKVTPGLALRFLAHDPAAWTEAQVTGDTEMAAAIDHIWRNIRWDVEEDLSKVVGDAAAHRLVRGAASLQQWGAQTADNVARSMAEYWTEERPLVAGAADLAQFNQDVDDLRNDVARLEKRLELMARQPSASDGR
jgi:ubiquinone biosynthesis accessory factor UbiJ